jgi:hypothetical protein
MAARTSRLKRLEERRAITSSVKYIVLTIAVIVLLFSFGLPVLSRLTAFIAEFTGQETAEEVDSTPLPPPRLDNLPAFTNEKTLRVTGATRPGHTVFLFFNSEKSEVLANANGEFTNRFELSLGENTIYAYVADPASVSSKTQVFSINYDNEPPKLEIIAPENGKQFTGRDNHAQIEGQTEPDARISINNRVAIVQSDGKFSFPLVLEEGQNTLKAKAVDKAGNEAELELTLNYTK